MSWTNEQIKEYQRRPEVKLRRRYNDLLKYYNLTPEKHAEILQRQNYKCAFPHCDIVVDILSPIDHDHNCCPYVAPRSTSCGKCIRGILCAKHNVGLGYFDSNPECLFDAYAYLRGMYVKA